MLHIVESIAKILALLAGGAWAYYSFWLRREKYPAARLRHRFSEVLISKEERFVRVEVIVENVSSKLIQIEHITCTLQQLYPLAETDDGPFKLTPTKGNPEVPWPTLAHYPHSFPLGAREVEPKEIDTFQFDFVIPQNVEVVQAYSYVDNRVKRRKGKRWYFDQTPNMIGWNETTIFKIGEHSKAEKDS